MIPETWPGGLPGKKVLWKSKIRPCRWSAYDCLHDLVITVESDKLVRIYLLNPVPVTLTAPPSPRGPEVPGCVVKTRLKERTGKLARATGYAGRLPESSQGALFKMASKTDENGYAENFYYGPPWGKKSGGNLKGVGEV